MDPKGLSTFLDTIWDPFSKKLGKQKNTTLIRLNRACSSAWIEWVASDHQVVGSNPAKPVYCNRLMMQRQNFFELVETSSGEPVCSTARF